MMDTISQKPRGILRSQYEESQVVRATRWVAVTTLIHEAFPELRPALNLFTLD